MKTFNLCTRRHKLCLDANIGNNVNGGCLRVYISKNYYPVNPRVYCKFVEEVKYLKSDNLKELQERIEMYGEDIRNYLRDAKTKGKPIYGLGASTKGNTLLQIFDLDTRFIQAIGEINPDKFGLKTVTGILIIPEKDVLNSDPGLIIILPWHFTDTFVKVTQKYLDKGGEVLFPLPIPVILYKDSRGYKQKFL